MAPEIASWDPENSPGRPEAHLWNPSLSFPAEVAWLFENYKVFSRSN